MTYDTRKSKYGQEFVEEVEIICDACKYTQGLFLTDRYIQPVSSVGAAALGNYPMQANAGTWVALWADESVKYGLTSNNEIFSFTVNSSTSISMTARGLFGTTAATISSSQQIKIMHRGEADNSCRGFPFTCSTPSSYSETAKLRLKYATAPTAGGVRRFAGLKHGACKHIAGEVDPGESIGTPASLSFSILDQKHNDFDIVPYPNRRTEAGTMFGKLLARHPYFAGRDVIYREGYRDAGILSEPEWIERTFTIESANLSKEIFTVKALDPVILTEEKKAKMPVSSPALLFASVTSATTVITYIDAPPFYFGPLAAVRYIRIDSEVLVVTVASSFGLTVSVRGYRSESKDHDAGASIQDCVFFDNTHGIDAITFAISTYTSIKPEYLDDYSAVKAKMPTFILDACLISKPMAVAEFISAIIKLGNLIFFFDSVAKKLVIDYIPELKVQPIFINGSKSIERDSVKVDDNIKNQFTRFAHLWAPVDITKDSEENFAIRYMPINISLESKQNLGQVNEKKIFKNMLLTSSPGDSLLATSYASRVLDSNAQTPKIITATLNAADVGATQNGVLKLGSIISLTTQENQDKDGNSKSELFQVLKISGNGYENFDVKMRRYLALSPSVIDFVITTGGINYNLSSVFAPAAGAYTVYINPGVVFGSYSTALPAFTTGTQAAGVTLTIINRGSMLGMGGAGGDGELAGTGAVSAQGGSSGGNAFEATVPVIVDTGSGLIWAGGGGSAGGPMTVGGSGGTVYASPSVGGGGGQGYGNSISGQYSNGGFVTGGGPLVVTFSGRQAGGSQSSPGVTNGGSWGSTGSKNSGPALAGSAGAAIKSNGNTVTIVAGNNDLNIRGRRI